jgi:hypothetical protein
MTRKILIVVATLLAGFLTACGTRTPSKPSVPSVAPAPSTSSGTPAGPTVHTLGNSVHIKATAVGAQGRYEGTGTVMVSLPPGGPIVKDPTSTQPRTGIEVIVEIVCETGALEYSEVNFVLHADTGENYRSTWMVDTSVPVLSTGVVVAPSRVRGRVQFAAPESAFKGQIEYTDPYVGPTPVAVWRLS